MSIIVVEGVDGSGKTTLIDQLRQASLGHFVTLSRSGPPKKWDEIRSVLHWMERGSDMPTTVIADRHPLISEPIYGRILRGRSFLDGPHWSDSASKHHFLDCIDRVIYCCPPDEVIHRYVGHHPQLKGVIPNLDKLIAAYHDQMNKLMEWGVSVIWYNREPPAQQWPIEELFYGDIL